MGEYVADGAAPGDDVDDGRIRIGVLGPLQVRIDGVPVPAGGPTQRSLIVALAVAALGRTALSVDDLIDSVYGCDLPPRPRRSLATLVWRLRRQWTAEAVVSDGYSYRLDDGMCTVDAGAFETLVYRGRTQAHEGDPAAGIGSLRAALALWRDPNGPEAALPEPERLRLTELRLGAMDHLAQLLAETGSARAAVEILEQVVAARPDWEHSQARLIDNHLRSGDVADGLRVYDTARRVLADQGVEPGPDLERAAARLVAARREDPAPAVPSPRRPTARATTRRVVTPDRGEMVGRGAELDGVVSALSSALRDRTSTAVLISGEPGIGKSALARSALAAISGDENPACVIRLGCDPRRTLPYAPLAPLGSETGDAALAALLGGAGPDAADVATGRIDDTAQIHRALVRWAGELAGPRGLVLLVEDLHWAPVETVHALAALLAGTVDLPVVVLGTSRDFRVPEPLAVHVGRHLRLRGLSARAVAEFVGAEPGDAGAARLRRATGGNPLYLRQLQRSGARGAGGGPDSLEAAIETHLRLIPAQVVAALEIASVIGDRFGLPLLAALTGPFRQPRPLWTDRLHSAARAGLVEQDASHPSEYAFVHALIREHLYRGMSAERRTAAHAEIGRALDRIAWGRPCPADLMAHHYTRGWPDITTREVVDKLGAAARAAAAQLDFGQAEAHYRAALEHLAMDPSAASDAEVAATLGAAAGAAAADGDLAAANELYESQRSFADRTGLLQAHLFASLGALRTQYARRARPQVADNLADALADVAGRGGLREMPHLVGEALAAVQVYRPHRVAELIAVIGATAPDLVTGLQLAVWEHRTVADQVAIARQLVRDPAADPAAAWLRLWVGEVAAGRRALDDPPECAVPLSRADDQTQFDLVQWRVATHIAMGRLHRARQLVDTALAAPRHPDPAENARRVASFYGQRMMLTLLDGKPADPQRSPLIENPTWASRHPIMRYVGAYMLALRGEGARSRERCDDLLDEVADGDIPESDLLPRLMLLADACLRSGHVTGLEPCLAALLSHRGEHGIFRFGQYWGAADQSIGGLQVALGDLDGGIVSLRAALEQFERIHATLYVPIAQRSLADALQRRADRDDDAEVAALRWRADATDRRLGMLHRVSEAAASELEGECLAESR